MARKAENDNDIVEFEQDGRPCWAARGSRAYRDHKEQRSTVSRVPSATTVETPKAAVAAKD